MRDGAIHYKLYLLKLTMAVDNIVFRIIKGTFYCSYQSLMYVFSYNTIKWPYQPISTALVLSGDASVYSRTGCFNEGISLMICRILISRPTYIYSSFHRCISEWPTCFDIGVVVHYLLVYKCGVVACYWCCRS